MRTPAAGVVLRRRDRQELGRRVEPELAAARHDGREPLLEELLAQVTGVEEDVVLARLLHPVDDGPGDHVARREVRERVTSLHEPHAVAVDQEGALAAHGLGDERLLAARPRTEPQHGGVELHELDVGHHRAGPQRRRHAVAGRDRRVGGRRVDLPEAAGGQHDRTGHGGADAVHLALADDVQRHAADAGLVVLQQVHDERVLDHLDAGVVLDAVQRGDEGAGDLLAGGVPAGVGDPVPVVAALAGQLELALVVEVELGTEGDELADPRRAPRAPVP